MPAGKGIRCPKINANFKLEGICWHYTGNWKPTSGAQNHRKYWENTNIGAHFVVDEKETILCASLDETIWHAGPSDDYTKFIKQKYPRGANLSLIGAELCVNGDWNKVYRRAVELGVWLCRNFGMDPYKDFVRHYDCTGKQCPLAWAGNTTGGETAWNGFKADVAKLLRGGVGMPKEPTDKISREDKVKIMQRGKDAGLLNQVHDPEEIAEKWFSVALMLNALDVLKKAKI